TERLIDYVRSSATHAGGITGLRQIMTFAGVYGIRSGFHGPTDVSPVGMAANLHLGLAIHNFGIQEYMPHSATTLEVFRTSYRFEDGLLHPGETPGLGVDLDREAAAAHEYVPAYLPVNRLADGTGHDCRACTPVAECPPVAERRQCTPVAHRHRPEHNAVHETHPAPESPPTCERHRANEPHPAPEPHSASEPHPASDRLSLPERSAATRLIVVMRAASAEQYPEVISTLADAGVRSMELTL